MNTVTPGWGEVEIRRDDDGLVVFGVGGEGFPRIQTASIRAVGGTLLLDVTDSTAIPRVLLDDPFLAQAWLEPVFGSAVADAVAEFEDEDHHGVHRVVAERGELAGIIGRLGVGYWLHRWWPSGSDDVPDVDVRLLELEIGALAWLGEALFVDPTPIQRLLQPHTEALVQLVGELRATPGSQAERHLGILTTALRATADLVDEDTPGYAESIALLELIDTEDAAVAAAFDSVNWESLAADLTAPVIGAARHLPTRVLLQAKSGSRSASPDRSGHSEADWLQLAPRSVIARHGNVTWLIHVEDDTSWLTVRVDASTQNQSAVLLARVYDSADLAAFPEVFALDYDQEGQMFIGRRAVERTFGGEFSVDVFDPEYATRPRVSETGRSTAAGERRHIIEVLVDRRYAADGFIAERAAWTEL